MGRILKRLRLKQADRTATRRGWLVSVNAVMALARAYGVEADGYDRSSDCENARNDENDGSPTDPPESSVTGDTSVTSVTADGEDADGPDERERFDL